ncbi:MAG: hypothetical protein ACRBCI_01795 [Cellvibrionaceae bacterium]
MSMKSQKIMFIFICITIFSLSACGGGGGGESNNQGSDSPASWGQTNWDQGTWN